MKTEGVKERLIEYLDAKNIGKAEFGRKIGVSSAFVTSIRKSIQPDKLKSIALNYPDLNTSWLMTGEGTMLLNVEDKVGFTDEFEMKEVFKESQNEYNSKKGDVVLSREVFEQISRLTETVLSQQRTIELMQREKVKRDARMEEDATCADVAGSDIGR